MSGEISFGYVLRSIPVGHRTCFAVLRMTAAIILAYNANIAG